MQGHGGSSYAVGVAYSHNRNFCARVCVVVWLSRVPLSADHSDRLRRGSVHRGALAQEDPLEAVRRHAVLLLRLGVALRVGAAGGGALRGAQVVHERQSVLPTEVHELNVADARVKVDACWGKGKQKDNKSAGRLLKTKVFLFQIVQNSVLPAHLGLGHLLARSR